MSIGKLLSEGGWAMYPIYLCSFVALFFFCERFFMYWRIRARELVWLGPFLKRIEQQTYQDAVLFGRQVAHPVADVLVAMTSMHQVRPARVEAEAQRVGQLMLAKYERFLSLLSFISQVAPLLGLLGTVLGMVKMFYGLQQAGLSNVDASALSSGIWQALLTTAAGLIVAAPTLAAYMYLTSRVERLRQQMSDAVTQLLHMLAPSSKGQTDV